MHEFSSLWDVLQNHPCQNFRDIILLPWLPIDYHIILHLLLRCNAFKRNRSRMSS